MTTVQFYIFPHSTFNRFHLRQEKENEKCFAVVNIALLQLF